MGKQMKIEISRMANNGKGVGTAPDGKTVFVSGAVPEDRLLVEVTAERSRFYEARILEILSPSPDRIVSDCPEMERCGGCCFRQMTYARELEAKTGFVQDAFRRISGFDISCEAIIPSPLTEAYRNKAEFAIGTDEDGNLFAGFYSEKTHHVIPLENCRLVPDEFLDISNKFLRYLNLNEIYEFTEPEPSPEGSEEDPDSDETFQELMDILRKAQAEVPGTYTPTKPENENIKLTAFDPKTKKGDIRQLILKKSGTTGEIMLCAIITKFIGERLDNAADQIRREFPSVSSVCRIISPPSEPAEWEKVPLFLGGARFIQDEICGVPVEIGPNSFFQVNTPAAELLYQTAAEFARIRPEDVVLDLYCGMGTIGLAIASGCRRLVGGEIMYESVTSAYRSAKKMGVLNAVFHRGDAAEITDKLIRQELRPDLIILDPPRRGCSPETLQAVLTLDPDRIVMVSCDPATAARDCRVLCDHGYTLTRLRPVDLFPRTKHVETVALLSRRKDEP